MVREILVVSRNKLFSEFKEFEGFITAESNDFVATILNNFHYSERNDSLENDSSFKQIIPYVWLVNPKTKKIFLYQRASSGAETRLHNKYSGGVGGHIDKDTDELAENPIVKAMMRELHEEVTMQNYPTPKIFGYLNDESGSVEKVHFGVVSIGETEEDVTPAEDMASGRFYSIDEVDSLFSDPNNNVEKWTLLSWPFVKKYLS
jgi:predicted NUDIX family phosphoesterase